MSIILGLPYSTSVIVSATFAVLYTFAGGLFSVAYTDVLQLLCIPLGLVRIPQLPTSPPGGRIPDARSWQCPSSGRTRTWTWAAWGRRW